MSIPSISGVGRVATSTADTPASATPSAANTSRPGTAAPAVTIDELTQQPVPPRFPWLSRLSQQLEAASKQRAAFPPAPALGDNLDKTA